MITTSCIYCDAAPVPQGDEIEHDASCPIVTVPAAVDNDAIVAQACEVARLFHHHATGPWWRAQCRLVVMCERRRPS